MRNGLNKAGHTGPVCSAEACPKLSIIFFTGSQVIMDQAKKAEEAGMTADEEVDEVAFQAMKAGLWPVEYSLELLLYTGGSVSWYPLDALNKAKQQ